MASSSSIATTDDAGSAAATTMTTTIFRPEIVTGSHVLEIERYKETNGFLGIGNFFRSCPFTIGGHSWSIRYYPAGKDREFKDYISVYLERLDDTDSAATMLVLAEQHGCHGLKQACLRFISSPRNMKVVMAAEGFEYLTRSCPFLLKELAVNIPV